MKKILFVTLALGYGVGGSEKALIEMLKKLDLNKYHVTVLSLLEKPEKPFVYDNINVIYGYADFLHITKPIRQMVRNLKDYTISEIFTKMKLSLIPRFLKGDVSKKIWINQRRHIKKFDQTFDVVIGYGVNTATFFAIDKVDADKKVVWVNTDLRKAHLDLNFIEKYYKKADSIVVDAETGISRFLEIYPYMKNKLYAVRNILNTDELFDKAKDGQGFTDEFDGIRILSVGRLTEAKAFHYAIKSAAILKKKNYKFKWYIIGFGELESDLKKLALDMNVDDCVIFLGQQLNPYPYFAQTDLYVQTSIFEGSCITLEEALAFCKPVISTNFPAAFEKVVDGKNGYIVEMNESSISNAIEHLLRNNELIQEIKNYQKSNPLKYDKEIDKFYEIINK